MSFARAWPGQCGVWGLFGGSEFVFRTQGSQFRDSFLRFGYQASCRGFGVQCKGLGFRSLEGRVPSRSCGVSLARISGCIVTNFEYN